MTFNGTEWGFYVFFFSELDGKRSRSLAIYSNEKEKIIEKGGNGENHTIYCNEKEKIIDFGEER